MLKKCMAYFISFFALFCLNLNLVKSYEFIDQKNKQSVIDKINQIYDLKDQYEDLAGKYESLDMIHLIIREA